jgi:mRNA-degrading endonuclease RelE of RelBE toxin-antitoxin system
MIQFVSITSFRQALDALLKVKRGVYAGLPSEICAAFRNVSIEQIRANRDMVLMDSESITIKLRLPDKRLHLSKSEGYRLIYLVLKGSPVVAFLTVYPKRGPLQQLDIPDAELRMLISLFTVESRARQIVIHDINNNLKELPVPTILA